MMKRFLLACTTFLTLNATAQVDTANWFDFWIGSWTLTWQQADSTEASGVNKLERVLNDNVIKENFEALNGVLKGYVGKSWSVYNPSTRVWKQTWVDNSGSYLDFTGRFEDGKRYFERTTVVPGTDKPLMQRMVFYNIKPNSFDWDWENSTDEGKTWNLAWRIHYNRNVE